jgi:hypothetical protein
MVEQTSLIAKRPLFRGCAATACQRQWLAGRAGLRCVRPERMADWGEADRGGQGPALAILLAGPALSLPSMIVLASVMGVKKMLVYVSLVVVMATITGLIYGALA